MKHTWFDMVCKAAPEMGAVQAFEDFVEMAFHLILGDREKALAVRSLANGGEERQAKFAEALHALAEEMGQRRFSDVLGEVHQEIRGTRSQQATGSFYTPESLCDAMAQMTMDQEAIRAKVERHEIVRVQDPTIGAGRTLLSCAKIYRKYLPWFRFYGTDMELNACRMAFVNMALNGMAAEVTHGNELTQEVWARWRTPEWYAYEGMEHLETLQRVMRILEPLKQEEQKEEPPALATPEAGPQQLQFSFV